MPGAVVDAGRLHQGAVMGIKQILNLRNSRQIRSQVSVEKAQAERSSNQRQQHEGSAAKYRPTQAAAKTQRASRFAAIAAINKGV